VPRRNLYQSEILDLFEVICSSSTEFGSTFSLEEQRKNLGIRGTFSKSDGLMTNSRPTTSVVKLFACWTVAHYSQNVEDQELITSLSGKISFVGHANYFPCLFSMTSCLIHSWMTSTQSFQCHCLFWSLGISRLTSASKFYCEVLFAERSQRDSETSVQDYTAQLYLYLGLKLLLFALSKLTSTGDRLRVGSAAQEILKGNIRVGFPWDDILATRERSLLFLL